MAMTQSNGSSTGAAKRGRLRSLLASLGLVSIAATAVSAQVLDYRSPDAAPPAWGQFSKLVKYRFEEWMGADEAVANRFRGWLKETNGTANGAPASIVVKAWLNPDGSVEKVTFAPFKDERANSDLRTVLTRGNVGEAPPPEMLQPINLRFSLNLAKD
jgi:hypothetical protein